MTNIPGHIIQVIKASTNIVSVIAKYVKLRKLSRGSSYMVGLCPFHNEKTPSFKVNIKRQTWCCYGCGRGQKESGTGSDVFSFIKEIEEVGFVEACEILAEQAGIVIPTIPVDPAVEILKDEMTAHNRRYALNLWNNTNQLAVSALKYLRGRGLTDKTICDWRLGLVPPDELNNRNDIISIAGRISIAIIENKESSPKTLGMAYRDAKEPPSEPKYKNDPTSLCFHKGTLLYGLNYAAKAIKEEKFGIFTECYFGTMILHQYGIQNVVSTMGTSVTEEQIILAKQYSKHWIFLYDPDEAGYNAVIKALPLCLKVGITPYIVQLPPKFDPDEFMIHLKNKDLLIGYIKMNRKNVLEMHTDDIVSKYEKEVLNKKIHILKRLDPLLSLVDGIEGEVWKTYIYKRINMI